MNGSPSPVGQSLASFLIENALAQLMAVLHGFGVQLPANGLTIQGDRYTVIVESRRIVHADATTPLPPIVQG